jgi:hypothetical protein
MYGWGLIAYYELTGNVAYRTAAENLAADSEARFSSSVPGQRNMAYYGTRQGARHLLLAVRVAEANPITRWINHRDKMINLWMQSPDWDASKGMYWYGQYDTDNIMGTGSYAAGNRVMSAFQIGILAEALYQAFRVTGRTDIKNKLIAMAQYVNQYGLDPVYQYTASFFGFKNGLLWHSYSSSGTATFWDPVYTTSLVNTLVIGYKLTGNRSYYDRAKYFFNRGTKGVYGSPILRSSPDNVVDHFIDSRCGPGFTPLPNCSGDPYLAYNKGELQYTYMLFENGGNPTVIGTPDTTPPSAPKGLKIK